MRLSRVFATMSLGYLLLFAAAVVHASTVTCESRNNAYKTCPVDASEGVRLTRQLSSQGCWENDTWGFDRDRIWVDRGCRAEFQVGQKSKSASNTDALAAAAVVGLAAAAIIASSKHDHHNNKNDSNYDRYDDRYYENSRYGYNGYGGDPRRTFSCESRGDRRDYCRIPARGHVEIYKQRSHSPCKYGRSWGVDGNSVWVSDGCRAEFAVF